MKTLIRFAAITLTAGITLASLSATAFGAQVGTIGSANGDVRVNGRPAAAGTRVSGKDVVSTGGGSSGQVLLKDRSTLTLGSNSSASPDDSSGGSTAVNIAKGAFRYISGSANNNKVKTPVASIGIRGSIIEGYVDDDTHWEVIVLVQGEIEICTVLGCEIVNIPGSYIRVKPNGGLVGPAVWRGPFFDLYAGINFVRNELHILLEPDQHTRELVTPPPTGNAPAAAVVAPPPPIAPPPPVAPPPPPAPGGGLPVCNALPAPTNSPCIAPTGGGGIGGGGALPACTFTDGAIDNTPCIIP